MSKDADSLNCFTAFLVGLILMLILIGLFNCTSAPTKAFNSEDKQDGTCYATLGGGIGYCNEALK